MKRIFLLYCLFTAVCISNPAYTQHDSSGYYSSFDGIKIYYEVHGKGYPVVLVHGFTGTGEGWKRSAIYKELLKEGYQVIIPDLRGNGKSDKPHKAKAYANDAEAKDIMGLITRLGIDKYSVAGYSRGSIITARLLVLDNRIDKAVLGGMGTGFTDPEWPRRKLFYRALSGEPVKELESFLQYVKNSGFDRQALAMQQKEQPSTSPAALGKIQQPVLVISGDEDEDNGSAKDLAKLLPHSVYKTVPGKHNGTSSTAPYAKELMAFLKSKEF